MSTAHLGFIAISVAGLSYFLIALRRFDFFSVAYLSGCIYFLPGFFGYTMAPVSALMLVPVDLEQQTFLVMMLVLIAIWLGAFISDHMSEGHRMSWRFHCSGSAALFAVVLAMVGYLFTVVTAGGVIMGDDKVAIMESLNRWHVLGASAAPLAAVLSFATKRWVLFTGSIAMLLFDLYLGFRTSFAVAIIAILTLHLFRFGPQRVVVHNWRVGCTGLAIVVVLFIYKHIFSAIKLGLWDVVVDQLATWDIYYLSIVMSEPFNTQAILNEIVAQDFRVGVGHFKDVLLQFLLFSPELGSAPLSFNDLFQSTLFPSDLDYGMANNIWAEMFSSGGWPLLSLFVAFFVCMLMIGSYLLRSPDEIFAAGVALAFSYWAFYIHRNDLLYQVNLEKRTVLVWIACLLLSLLCRDGRSKPNQNMLRAIRVTRGAIGAK